MWLAEGTQAYADAYDARFGDVDDENPIIIEKCIVEAEEEAGWIFPFPEDFEFETFKSLLKKFYESYINAYIDTHYWKYHAKYYNYIL